MTNETILAEIKRIELEKHIRTVAQNGGDSDGTNYYARLNGLRIVATFHAGENGTRVEDENYNTLYRSSGFGSVVQEVWAGQWIYDVIAESKHITAEQERKVQCRDVKQSAFAIEVGFKFIPV